MSSQKPRIQCLDRAMDILETLAQHRALGVTELAKIVGLHVATTHNILLALQGRNYLLNNAGQYRLGPALAALACQGDPLMVLPSLAQPHLEEITRLTGESAVVAVLSGTRVIMIATTASVDGLSCPFPNQVFPSALMLATGEVLVAYQPEKEWKKHFDAYVEQTGPLNGVAPDDLTEWKRTFQTIRGTGQYLKLSGKDSGSVAVPLRDAAGAVVAALGANSIGRFGDEEYQSRLVAAVREAGCIVSRVLGHVPETEKESV